MSADPLRDTDRESRGGPFPPPPRREPAFNIPAVVLVFIALCVGIHLVRGYLLTPAMDFEVILAGAFIPLRYSGEYLLDLPAFTSPLTYSLLHGGLAHLAVNMIWLAAFGSPLATRIGPVRFVLFWCATTLAAVALHYVLHMDSNVPLVGASGAISGMMGAAARFGFRSSRGAGRAAFEGRMLTIPEALSSRTVVTFLAVWFVINLATGLASGIPGVDGAIAWEAHVGGFLAGFLAVRLFDRRRA
ncbi:rhomboid family intramembrane serine protease [Aquibium sp. ELW1220]|uniref:rhomboid family intramembrane serine protease n=1 Tax=Aquibium sp. ELW1220 TaxID=2976766 RepID=UPI0025B12861|nr:rhomboid family intramembrane serine protease [Aquibium sp. ELW1220]MDN2579238.1 rhomboid family intramembrane serine protease [Aquibium sp. ELW1220]